MRDLLTTVLLIGQSAASSAPNCRLYRIFLVPGEGFEPDRGVARRDPHEPIARGALSGNQRRDSLLLKGLRPLGRQHTTLPCHPLLREGDPLPRAPSPVGVQSTKHQEMRLGAQTTSPQSHFLVPGEGFEPPRETHTPLKRTRLPIPPARHGLSRSLYGAHQKPSKAS